MKDIENIERLENGSGTLVKISFKGGKTKESESLLANMLFELYMIQKGEGKDEVCSALYEEVFEK